MRLVSTALRLLCCWWHADRIRISPREGRLLRLAPPCYLRLAGEPAAVVRRQVVAAAGGPAIVYRCETVAGPCELVVQPTAGKPVMILRRDGTAAELADADVAVIPAAKGGRWWRRWNC